MKNIDDLDEKTKKQLMRYFHEAISLAVTYRDQIANEDSIVLLKNLFFIAHELDIAISEEYDQLFREMKEHFQEYKEN